MPELDKLKHRLTEVSFLELSIEETWSVLREALTTDIDPKYIVQSLTGAVWQLLLKRETGAVLADWFRGLKLVSVRLNNRGHTELVAQIEVLCDLVHSQISFPQRQPLDEISSRHWIQGMLKLLRDHPEGCLPLSEIADELGVREDLMRGPLRIMQTHGVIRRYLDDQTKMVEILSGGLKLIRIIKSN